MSLQIRDFSLCAVSFWLIGSHQIAPFCGYLAGIDVSWLRVSRNSDSRRCHRRASELRLNGGIKLWWTIAIL